MRRVFGGLAALVMLALAVLGVRADALPLAPEAPPPVTGIPDPCPSLTPWPGQDVPIEEVRSRFGEVFGFELTGKFWTEEYRPSIKILWETLDAVGCTPYLATVKAKAPGIGINASNTRGWAWGDWSLTRSNHITFDFAKFKGALEAGDEGRLVRLVIHELGHAWSADRHSRPSYWTDFRALSAREGRFSEYAGRKDSEIFADVLGYYVGRCALDNPYDSGEHAAYYAFAKDVVFEGKEFGPAPGEQPDCTLPDAGATEPLPGETGTPSWIVAVSEE